MYFQIKIKVLIKKFLCKGTIFEKNILRIFYQTDKGIVLKGSDLPMKQKEPEAQKIREKIAKRASQEIQSGMYVNLGVGFSLRKCVISKTFFRNSNNCHEFLT